MKKKFIFGLFLICLSMPIRAFSCSGANDIEIFEINKQPLSLENKISPLVISIDKIERGSFWRFLEGSCSDRGAITLSVLIPPNSDYEKNDFGIKVKVLSGNFPDVVFPEEIVNSFDVGSRKKVFTFYWLDGNKLFRERIVATLEITAFLKDGRKSEPVIVNINE